MNKILYVGRHGKLCLDNDSLLLEDKKVAFLSSGYLHFLCKCRLFNRLLRLEPRIATVLSEKEIIFSYKHRVKLISFFQNNYIKDLQFRPGFSNPLNSTKVDDEIYWGDYGQNINLFEINIYKYSVENGLQIVYTFPSSTIKHVHNILYDKWRNRFFIFTGDLNENVGIYVSSRDFKEVNPFLIGSEQYRAVIGKVTQKGLFWATDAVMEDNHVYYCNFEGPKEIKTICNLNGSVIYGCETAKGFVISTTVEPYPSKKSKLLTLLDNRKGPGIKSNEVFVLHVLEDGTVKELARYKKDFWPMRLFQYGQVTFPYYEVPPVDTILCNPVAVKKWDGKIVELKL